MCLVCVSKGLVGSWLVAPIQSRLFREWVGLENYCGITSWSESLPDEVRFIGRQRFLYSPCYPLTGTGYHDRAGGMLSESVMFTPDHQIRIQLTALLLLGRDDVISWLKSVNSATDLWLRRESHMILLSVEMRMFRDSLDLGIP